MPVSGPDKKKTCPNEIPETVKLEQPNIVG